jgi:hypothetical protein
MGEGAPNSQDGGAEGPGVLAPADMEAILRDLDAELDVGIERLVLFARAPDENHPCMRVGGFDTAEQMASSGKMAERPKSARGWPSFQAMVETEFALAKKHGVSGIGLIEGINDFVWELSSVEPVVIADLTEHHLTRTIDMSRAAVMKGTPASPQGRVISRIRDSRGEMIGGIELPTRDPATLPPELRVQHRERHLLVFPNRVKLQDRNLGRWKDILGFS